MFPHEHGPDPFADCAECRRQYREWHCKKHGYVMRMSPSLSDELRDDQDYFDWIGDTERGAAVRMFWAMWRLDRATRRMPVVPAGMDCPEEGEDV